MSTNKWAALPPLKTARIFPGSVLLESRRAFCVCGSKEGVGLSSIESIEIEREAEWKTLPMNGKIIRTYNLAGVEFKQKIVLFGGVSIFSNKMQILSLEGDLEKDLS